MSETTASANWLTQEAFDRLSTELEELRGPRRQDISKRIEAAREEGDLKENGGYHAAKEEQGKQEGRIRQLEELLRHAVVGEAPPDNGVVEPGMVVEAEVGGSPMHFLLGSREIGDGTELQVFSERSPLGAAIMGKREGESAQYDAPNGKTVAVKILSAKPFKA